MVEGLRRRSQPLDNLTPEMYSNQYRYRVGFRCGCFKLFYSPSPERGEDIICATHGATTVLTKTAGPRHRTPTAAERRSRGLK